MGNDNEKKEDVLVKVVYLGDDLRARQSAAKLLPDGSAMLVNQPDGTPKSIKAGKWLLKSEYVQMASEIAAIKSRKKASVWTTRRARRVRKVGVL